MMRILITSGGTIEKIDDVRNIRNSSTGRLSSLIANAMDENIIIDYVYGLNSLLPNRKYNPYPIESVRDLEEAMKHLLNTYTYDAVIHAMAVSDYEIQSVTTNEALDKNLKDVDILETLNNYKEDLNRDEKIRSDYEHLVVLMKKAPKIINMIKKIQKDTILVGFKLLTDVSYDTLLLESQKQILKNDCDYVLANDLKDIDGDNHIGYLVSKNNTVIKLNTKQEIAEKIKEEVLKI